MGEGKHQPITSSPVVADGKLFYGTWVYKFSSQLLAIDPSSGLILWENLADDNIYSSPSVLNGRVFFGEGLLNPAMVVALNETSGNQIWNYSTGVKTTISTAPALAYGNLYIGLDSSEFLALNQATGSLVWSFPTPSGSNATSATVYNGVVYFGTGRGTVFALNATTGAQIWSRTTGGAVASSPAFSIGSQTLFVGSNDGYLYALGITTGNVKWRYHAGSGISSSPALADGRVFFGSKDTNIYALGVIPPRLYDSISGSPTTLMSGQNSTLSVTVTNGTVPQAGVNLTFTSTNGGSFSTAAAIGPGTYQATFTAPIVPTGVIIVIQVTASRNGYLSGTNQTNIPVSSFPTLTVVVTAVPASVTPGAKVTLMVKVTNGALVVAGANVSISSSAGGSITLPSDMGNGNYTAIFTAPNQNSNPVVTVQASKARFTSGQAQTTVRVSGLPDLTSLTVAGVPFTVLLIAGVAAILILAVVIFSKKKKPYQYTPPKPSIEY